MKVMIISGSYAPAVCGVADAMAVYSEELRKQGVSVCFLTTEGYGPGTEEIPVHAVMEKWSFMEHVRIMKAIRQEMPDLIHIQYPTREYGKRLLINFLPFMLHLFLGIPVVITLHEYSFNLTWKGRVRLWPAILVANHVFVSDPVYIRDIQKVFRKHNRISCVTVIPGYDDTKIRKPGLKAERQDGEAYRVLWQEAIKAKPDWVLITSWNEWHEGSEIEPSLEYGNEYLSLTKEYGARFCGK